MSQPLEHALPAQSVLTLDEVFQAHQHWRSHKADYSGVGIPDDLWHLFFRLESQGYLGTTLRQMFGLNTQQYLAKQQRIVPTSKWSRLFF